MTYTVDSSFLSAPVGSEPQWVAAIAAHNATEAAEIVHDYFQYGAAIGINADLALAQACQETGWFTSDHWANQRNPAGIGVTGDGVPGPTFGSIENGIKAHYEHLVCYVMASDPPVVAQWGMLDPRHAFHDNLPRVADLVRPERKWANPGDGYAAAIVAIANTVVGDVPVSAPVPWDRVHNAADVGPSRSIASVKWFIVHDTEGHFDGDESVLTDAAPPVESAHFLVGRDPGQCVYMVDIGKTAWTAGNDTVSIQAIQVELSRAPDEVGYTDYQYTTLAAVFKWCETQGMTVPRVYIGRKDADGGPEPDVPGILGHQDVPDGAGGWGGSAHHTDPGPTFDWARMLAEINGVNTPPPDAYLHLNGHIIGGGFKNFYLAIPDTLRLQVMGLPISDEYTAQVTDPAASGKDADAVTHDRTVQDFERNTLIYEPENSPGWQVVCATQTQIIRTTLGN